MKMKFKNILLSALLFWLAATLVLVWAFGLEMPSPLSSIRGLFLGAGGLVAGTALVLMATQQVSNKKRRILTFGAVVPLSIVITPLANYFGFLYAGLEVSSLSWVYFFHGNVRLILMLFLFVGLLESLRKISKVPVFKSKIPLERNKKVTMVPMEEIFFIRSADDYVALHTKKGEFLKRSTLKTLKTHLDPEKFVRVHRAAIVNVAAIKALVPEPKGDFFLEFENGERLRGSRRYKSDLVQKFNCL